MTELPGGGFAMGESPDEAEARLQIAHQQGRAAVTFRERSGRYRWTVVLDGGKTSHGWAETEDEGWWFVRPRSATSGLRHRDITRTGKPLPQQPQRATRCHRVRGMPLVAAELVAA